MYKDGFVCRVGRDYMYKEWVTAFYEKNENFELIIVQRISWSKDYNFRDCNISKIFVVFRVYTPFHDGDKADADTGTKVWQSVANALILLGVICVMTIVLLLLYKFRCYKVTHSLPFFFSLSLSLSHNNRDWKSLSAHFLSFKTHHSCMFNYEFSFFISLFN